MAVTMLLNLSKDVGSKDQGLAAAGNLLDFEFSPCSTTTWTPPAGGRDTTSFA
jgi:hypothetical protein